MVTRRILRDYDPNMVKEFKAVFRCNKQAKKWHSVLQSARSGRKLVSDDINHAHV